MPNDLINSIENMSFKNMTIETMITKLIDWSFTSGVKLIVGILAIVIGFKIINKLSKRFIEFAEQIKTYEKAFLVLDELKKLTDILQN